MTLKHVAGIKFQKADIIFKQKDIFQFYCFANQQFCFYLCFAQRPSVFFGKGVVFGNVKSTNMKILSCHVELFKSKWFPVFLYSFDVCVRFKVNLYNMSHIIIRKQLIYFKNSHNCYVCTFYLIFNTMIHAFKIIIKCFRPDGVFLHVMEGSERETWHSGNYSSTSKAMQSEWLMTVGYTTCKKATNTSADRHTHVLVNI